MKLNLSKIVPTILTKNKSLIKNTNPYSIDGSNNIITIVMEDGRERNLGKNEEIKGLKIVIKGSNNKIRIMYPSFFEGAVLEMFTNNSEISISPTPRFMWYVKMAGGDNMKFNFGRGSDTSWFGMVHLLDSNAAVLIGEDCMFAGDIVIFASDAHAIYDVETKTVLNFVSAPVSIGNHCWICQGARFTKNAQIGNNVVVGNGSLVSKKILENNVVIAGNPAKVVKRNVNWDRKSASRFSNDNK